MGTLIKNSVFSARAHCGENYLSGDLGKGSVQHGVVRAWQRVTAYHHL